MAKVLFILAAPLLALHLLIIELPSTSGLPAAINGKHYQQFNQNIPVGRTSFNIGEQILLN